MELQRRRGDRRQRGGTAAAADPSGAVAPAAAEPPASPEPEAEPASPPAGQGSQEPSLGTLPAEVLALIADRLDAAADRGSLAAACRAARHAAWQHWATTVQITLRSLSAARGGGRSAAQRAARLNTLLARGHFQRVQWVVLDGDAIAGLVLPPPSRMPALVCVATSALPLWPLYIRYRNLPASPLLGSVLRHTQLEVLQLAHCGLVGLPQELTGFTRLRELGIQGNLLMSDEDWAPVVLALTQLEALDVSACQLSHLPDLRLLSRLHTLRLLGNTSWRLATGGAQQWLQLLELPQLRELSLDISVLECWPGYRALISQNDLAQQLIARGVRLAAQDATFGEWEWRVNALRRFARRALSVCLLVALLVALVALLAWVVAWTEAQGVGLCLEFFPKLDADWMRHASLVQEGGGSRIVLGGMVFECHMRLQGALKFADWVRRRRGLAPLSGPISAVLAPVPWLFLGAVPGCPV